MTVKLVVWDFDGVLNDNFRDGAFLWSTRFEDDFGVPLERFQSHLFGSGRFTQVLRGREDILDLLRDFCDASGCAHPPEAILAYWFERDDFPNRACLDLIDKLAVPSVIATNNEGRRAAYIRDQMGYGARVAEIFAAAEIGVAKPDEGFFEHIRTWGQRSPAEMLLVDDTHGNVEAADRLGWQVFQFAAGREAELADRLDQAGVLRS